MKCNICRLSDDDPILYGEFYTIDDISVHYFCLLFSKGLPQNGDDNEGILGFLPEHIKLFGKANGKKTCSYCHNKNASVKCEKCKKFFHFICGTKANCLYNFQTFKAFCHLHHELKTTHQHTAEWSCIICYDPMGIYNPVTSICTEHCNLNAWMHRKCLMKFALQTGYKFSCLLCQDANFRDWSKSRGIFVPDRDIVWEFEQGVKIELGPIAKCQAKICQKFHGRDDLNHSCLYIICSGCGGHFHEECISDSDSSLDSQITSSSAFYCNVCKAVIHNKEKSIINSTLIDNLTEFHLSSISNDWISPFQLNEKTVLETSIEHSELSKDNNLSSVQSNCHEDLDEIEEITEEKNSMPYHELGTIDLISDSESDRENEETVEDLFEQMSHNVIKVEVPKPIQPPIQPPKQDICTEEAFKIFSQKIKEYSLFNFYRLPTRKRKLEDNN